MPLWLKGKWHMHTLKWLCCHLRSWVHGLNTEVLRNNSSLVRKTMRNHIQRLFSSIIKMLQQLVFALGLDRQWHSAAFNHVSCWNQTHTHKFPAPACHDASPGLAPDQNALQQLTAASHILWISKQCNLDICCADHDQMKQSSFLCETCGRAEGSNRYYIHTVLLKAL